jgi:hypothetical protein
VYDPTVCLIASVWEGVGAEVVSLVLDVGSTELEVDGTTLVCALDAELDGESTLGVCLDATEVEEIDAELLLESLPPFVPFLT